MAPPERRPNGRARRPGPWKNGPIPVIGVVGGIGSGKSAVAAILGDLGAFVIDADTVGHALLNQRPVRDQVVARFGPTVLEPAAAGGEGEGEREGTEPAVDRRALGAIVFADPAARKTLESIIHPVMRRTFEKAVDRVARRGDSPAVVIDAAILYEAGWDALCDRVVFVNAPREVRLARLEAARGWDDAALAAREKAQWALVEKQGRADATVHNAGALDALRDEVTRVWKAILAAVPTRGRNDRTNPEPAAPPATGYRSRRSGHAAGGRPSRPRGRR